MLLYFPGVGSDGHRVVHFHATTDPTTEWTAQPLRDAVRFDRMQPYPLRDAPGYSSNVAFDGGSLDVAVESDCRKAAKSAPMAESSEIWIKPAIIQPEWFASHPIE